MENSTEKFDRKFLEKCFGDKSTIDLKFEDLKLFFAEIVILINFLKKITRKVYTTATTEQTFGLQFYYNIVEKISSKNFQGPKFP